MFGKDNPKVKAFLIHWIAILSIATTSLAPVLSQARQAYLGDQDPMAQICTSMGLKSIELNSEPENKSKLTNYSCPFCPVYLHLGMPINRGLDFALSKEGNLFPQSSYQPVRTLLAWSKYQSRAPPKFI